VHFKKESFQKGKQEYYERWEKKVTEKIIKLIEAGETFYGRKGATYNSIMNSLLNSKDLYIPECDLRVSSEAMEEVALSSYLFTTLPATNPSQQWPSNLLQLRDRWLTLKPAALWREPFDLNFKFHNDAIQFIYKTLKAHHKLSHVLFFNSNLNKGSINEETAEAKFIKRYSHRFKPLSKLFLWNCTPQC
jgi:hypothetical protein